MGNEAEMKTNIETQLKIISRMKDNIVNRRKLFDRIQYKNAVTNEWCDDIYDLNENHFKSLELRIKPSVINGIEIPMPIELEKLVDEVYYFASVPNSKLVEANTGKVMKEFGYMFVYQTKKEAIEVSKLLFKGEYHNGS